MSGPIPEAAVPSIGTGPSGGPDYECRGNLEFPHYSGTAGALGRVNVHAKTYCTIAQSIGVQVILEREYCILYFFCSWMPVAWGAYANPSARVAETVANRNSCDWDRSYFAAESTHEAFRPWGYSFKKLDTRPFPTRLDCLPIPLGI